MRLYPAGKAAFTEVGSLPDFVAGTLFPVDGYILADRAGFVIKPVV